MAVGYLTGGITHGLLANRAHDDECANRYFYPVFALSYLSMIGSSLAWLSTARKSLTQAICWYLLVASACFISGGASWCQATLHLYPGTSDPCATSGQPMCDRTMMLGEGTFYCVWIATWVTVALTVHASMKGDRTWRRFEQGMNIMAPASLLFGPGQIMLVCVLPLLYMPAHEAAATSMRWYCELRTGVTYILAVLASHAFSFVVSHARDKRLQANSLLAAGAVDPRATGDERSGAGRGAGSGGSGKGVQYEMVPVSSDAEDEGDGTEDEREDEEEASRDSRERGEGAGATALV